MYGEQKTRPRDPRLGGKGAVYLQVSTGWKKQGGFYQSSSELSKVLKF